MKWKSLSRVRLFETQWNSPGQNTRVGSLSLLQGNLPNPGVEPRSPALQADSLPVEPQGKPKNTGVGSLSLLQQIFLTLESNWGLRWILYQMSYQGIPVYPVEFAYSKFLGIPPKKRHISRISCMFCTVASCRRDIARAFPPTPSSFLSGVYPEDE